MRCHGTVVDGQPTDLSSDIRFPNAWLGSVSFWSVAGEFLRCAFRLNLLSTRLGEFVFGCILVLCFVMVYGLQFEKYRHLYERVQSLLFFGLLGEISVLYNI